LGDPGIDERIILSWILRIRCEFFWLRIKSNDWR